METSTTEQVYILYTVTANKIFVYINDYNMWRLDFYVLINGDIIICIYAVKNIEKYSINIL